MEGRTSHGTVGIVGDGLDVEGRFVLPDVYRSKTADTPPVRASLIGIMWLPWRDAMGVLGAELNDAGLRTGDLQDSCRKSVDTLPSSADG